jgi:Polypeptide deformylase
VLAELRAAAARIAHAHIFGKGMGIAAPQLGIDRAAALVRPPGSDKVIALLNPAIIEASDEIDEQYEVMPALVVACRGPGCSPGAPRRRSASRVGRRRGRDG